ncbi:hypothetical protein LguiB_007627 [Lonicera macranthoides]
MSGEFRRSNQILCQFLRSLEHVEVEEADDLPPGCTQIAISMDEEEINEHKFNPGDFPMDLSSPELATKLTVVLRDIATKGLWTAWRNVWEKFSLHVKDFACMSKRDFESLITISSELKTNADVLKKKEKENPKGGRKAGGKKEEEKKGEEDKKDEKKGEEEKKDENKGEEEKKDRKKGGEKKEDKQEGEEKNRGEKGLEKRVTLEFEIVLNA